MVFEVSTELQTLRLYLVKGIAFSGYKFRMFDVERFVLFPLKIREPLKVSLEATYRKHCRVLGRPIVVPIS